MHKNGYKENQPDFFKYAPYKPGIHNSGIVQFAIAINNSYHECV